MMVRTQISLESELHRQARMRSVELGVSLAQYLRQLIGRDLGDVRAGTDPAAVFDLGTSGVADIRRNKDDYIGEAVGARRPARVAEHPG